MSPSSSDSFAPVAIEIDAAVTAVRFTYERRSDARLQRFAETIFFDRPLHESTPKAQRDFLRSLPVLHAALGVSYFKASPASVLDLRQCRLTTAEVDLVRALFTDGLGEFAYVNDLPEIFNVTVVHGPPVETAPRAGSSIRGRALVPFGGGRDSFVTWALTQSESTQLAPFIVNETPKIARARRAVSSDAVHARRRLDVALLDPRVATYSGHVPITTLVSLIACSAAYLGGFDAVILSNESSASDPNFLWHGRPINHQWSKGIEAERLIQQAVESRDGGLLAYFSALRNFNEFQISRAFAELGNALPVFVSCNMSVRSELEEPSWCNACFKCRFVQLALAPHLGREQMRAMFGRSLLEDGAEASAYRQLAGQSGVKPFDCVGEAAEVRAAFEHLSATPEWYDAAVVRELARESVARFPWSKLVAEPSPPESAPQPFHSAMVAAIASHWRSG